MLKGASRRATIGLIAVLAASLSLTGRPAVRSGLAAPVGTTVQVWQTSQAGDRLTAKANLTFAADNGANLPTIEVNPTRYHQPIEGFGATFNEAGWYVMSGLSANARNAVMQQMFDPNIGAGFSLTRAPMGSDDFSLTEFTYDDLPSGTDFNMTQFSINPDLPYLIPYIQAAQQYGSFRIFGSPWTAPAWMKDNNALTNGGTVYPSSTDPRYYQALALYFEKYVQAYAAQGITVDSVNIQNEPQNPARFQSTLWTSAQQADFVANYLGPRFEASGIRTRIRIYEHNRDTWQYPKEVLDNAATAPYVAGVNFHNYECTFGPTYCMPGNLSLFNYSHPGYSLWMSEHTDVDVPNPADYLNGEKWGREIITDMRYGIGGWIYWNMVLDQNGGPVHPMSAAQDPLIMVNTATGQVHYLSKFWYLAHFARFVRPGAYRIGADGGQDFDGLSFVAFKNADGSEVVQVINASASSVQVKIRERGNIITPTLDAHSINTFKWSAPVNSYHVIAGGTDTWYAAAGDRFGPDAYYTGGTAGATAHIIGNTADDPLYQPERTGNFSYQFPVPSGRYQVTLGFAENTWNCGGCRTFNVSLEGAAVLSNFDIWSAAGGQYLAMNKSFTANVSDGNLEIQFTAVTGQAKVDFVAVTPLPDEGGVFTYSFTPGYVYAQDYNTGGEGYAYHFAVHSGSAFGYRTDAINLQSCTDQGCGYNLSWLSNGDWINYTVDVTASGRYDLDFRLASTVTDGQFSLDMDGVNIVPPTSVPRTGRAQAWTTVTVPGVHLTRGTHTFRFNVIAGGFNWRYMFFNKIHSLDTRPVKILAVWYAGGGEGKGYHETTPGSFFTSPYPGHYRPEAVDIEHSSENDWDVGSIANGEWLRYDYSLAAPATVTVTFRVATEWTGGRLHLALDGTTKQKTIGTVLNVPSTGGWQAWQDISETVTLPAGQHALYVVIDNGGFNLNAFTIQ